MTAQVEADATLAAALAETRAELEAAREALEGIAEGDCEYGDNCPEFGSRHYQCTSCKAREALDATREPR